MGEIKYKIADSSRAFINKDKDSVQTKNLQTYILQRIPIKRATDRKIKTITGLHSFTLFCGGFEIKVL